MEQGKYQNPRRRRRRRRRTNWAGIIFWLVLLAALALVISMLFKSCAKKNDQPEADPSSAFAETLEQDTTAPTEPPNPIVTEDASMDDHIL